MTTTHTITDGSAVTSCCGRTPFELPQDDRLAVTSIRDRVMAALAEGAKDEAVARDLGISVRTVRRHVADFMAEVGAGSRFQAGVAWRERLSSLDLTHASRST